MGKTAVKVHQSNKAPSIASAYSYTTGGYTSSTGSTASEPRSLAPGVYRDSYSNNGETYAYHSGKNTIVDYGRTETVQGAPTPGYHSGRRG